MADNSYAVSNLQALKENIMAYASYAEGHGYSPLYDKIEETQQAVQELIDAINDGEVKPRRVWVFTADQVSDDDTFDVITEVFDTEEAAKKHLYKFVYGEEGELEYADKRGWTVECNDPDHYLAFEDGYYSSNHTEATVEMREVKH